MLSHLLFFLTTLLLAGAGVMFFVYLIRGDRAASRRGVAVLAAALGGQVLFFAARYLGGFHAGELTHIQPTLGMVSLLIVGCFLVATKRERSRVFGVFVVPLALLFFLGAGFHAHDVDESSRMQTILLPLHILLNVLGVVAFALASVAACTYVLQERLLRRKKLAGMFKRLPSLAYLDALMMRLNTVGFPLLTLGILTGTLWSRRISMGNMEITVTQSLAIVSWFVFGTVLVLRYASGWRGRRAALGTLLGFAFAALVLVGYLLRSLGRA